MHLVHITASLGIGGAESVLYTLVEELQKTEIKQMVITFREGPYAEKIRQLGIQVHCINGLFVRYDPIFWFRLWRCVKQVKPDCIHSLLWASNIAARCLAKILGVPLVSGMHNSVVLYSRLSNVIDRVTLPMANHVVVIHEGVQESLFVRCNKHRYLPVTIIHNCIDCDSVRHQARCDPHQRQEFGFNVEHFVIGAVGRWIPIKRYPLLITQFAQVYAQQKQARLMLIGYGQDEPVLRALVKQLGLEDIVSFVVGKQAYGYFPLFDCFVLPSLTEGPAIALLEAMSFGLPCIVTHESSFHPVIIDHENGLLLPAYDEDTLSRAFISLIENKTLATRLGRAAQMTVESNFSASIMASSYRSVFERTVEQFNRG